MHLHTVRSIDRSSTATAEEGLRERHLVILGKEKIILEVCCFGGEDRSCGGFFLLNTSKSCLYVMEYSTSKSHGCIRFVIHRGVGFMLQVGFK
jgi:hypothetical protein